MASHQDTEDRGVPALSSNGGERKLQGLPEQWFPRSKWTMRRGSGGMNNTTRFVKVGESTYVLRVYETHQDEAKVRYEHQVLLLLAEKELPFQLPVPIQTPKGDTIVRVPGEKEKLAALFSYIEGINPVWESPARLQLFGEAVGQLSSVLQAVRPDLPPVYRPYYEIDQIHPRCSPQAIAAFCEHPPEPFKPYWQILTLVGKRLANFFSCIPVLKRLPHQLIHGDINASNMLVNEYGQVAAFLDFEFVTWDLRAMELAVCLTDVFDPAQAEAEMWTRIESFYKGYRAHVSLTEDEIDALPLLIELRKLDVCIHFLGRYLDGVDSADTVIEMMKSAAETYEWLEQFGQELVQLLKRVGIPGTD